MRKAIPFILSLLVPAVIALLALSLLSASGLAAAAESAAPGSRPQALSLGERIKSRKIVVIEFLPLPFNAPPGKALHERVFTDEFRSDSPEDAEISGWFVPRDYLPMIHQGLRSAADIHGLDLGIVANAGEVPAAADLIVMGAVKQFSCGSQAAVTIAVKLFEGRAPHYRPLAEKEISRTVDPGSLSMIINYPIHTIGRHANDFHPPRTLLNMAAAACITDLLQFMAKEAK